MQDILIINQFLQNFLLSSQACLGKIADWFFMVEYQQRGSPHIHKLIWLEDAPIFGVHNYDKVIAFMDQIITCKNPTDDHELLKLIITQVHCHSHTCQKKSRAQCCFNYLQPLMPTTKILDPLDIEDMEESKLKEHKNNWKSIQNYLNDLKGVDITFAQLLINLKITKENYMLAVRSALNASTIFLKREPNELKINNYNPACHAAWRANMDIQFVLDVYACATYIASYISKLQKGVS